MALSPISSPSPASFCQFSSSVAVLASYLTATALMLTANLGSCPSKKPQAQPHLHPPDLQRTSATSAGLDLDFQAPSPHDRQTLQHTYMTLFGVSVQTQGTRYTRIGRKSSHHPQSGIEAHDYSQTIGSCLAGTWHLNTSVG